MLFLLSNPLLRLTLLFLLPVSVSGDSGSLFGMWREPTGSVIEVYRCGNEACLRLVVVSSQAPTQKDERNPDKSLRSRPLCGLQIGGHFYLQGETKGEGGSLYDPKSGRTYSGSMTRVGDELLLRGYYGLKLFGATETWKRVNHVVACVEGSAQ